MEPIKCPKCGAIVKVTAIRFPDVEWKCLMCGESGSIKQCATSGYIQKVDEPDPGVGVITTNATGGYSTFNPTPVAKSTATDSKSTACDIPEKPSIQQGWQCPKCGAILAPYQSYCPFCSPSEYGRSNWVVTTPVRVPLEQYTNPNTNNNNTAPSAIPDYRPFCSPSEYGRTNWLGTNTPTSGQYTNPNTSTTIS